MKNEEITISDVTKTEEYVSLENAQLLKKVGFNWLCLCRYIYGIFVPCDSQMRMFYHKNSSTDENECTCPTIQMVLRWLRKNHNIHIDIDYIDFLEHGEVWSATIVDMVTFKETKIESTWNSYEQMANEGIKYCITNIIQKSI